MKKGIAYHFKNKPTGVPKMGTIKKQDKALWASKSREEKEFRELYGTWPSGSMLDQWKANKPMRWRGKEE